MSHTGNMFEKYNIDWLTKYHSKIYGATKIISTLLEVVLSQDPVDLSTN